MKGLILKPMISLLLLGGSWGRCISFPPRRHLSSSWLCRQLAPAPHQWRQSSQRQAGGDWFRYWSTLTHIKPFTSLWARWPANVRYSRVEINWNIKNLHPWQHGLWSHLMLHTKQRAAPGKLEKLHTGDAGAVQPAGQPGGQKALPPMPKPTTIFSAWGCCRAWCSEGQGRKEAWP